MYTRRFNNLQMQIDDALTTMSVRGYGNRFDVNYVDANKLVADLLHTCKNDVEHHLDESGMLAGRLIAWTILQYLQIRGVHDDGSYALPYDITVGTICLHMEGPKGPEDEIIHSTNGDPEILGR